MRYWTIVQHSTKRVKIVELQLQTTLKQIQS